MTRDEAIARIRKHEREIRALGATGLYLYGSTARDESREDSDVDVFVDYDPGKFSLLDLAELKHVLEDDLGVEVDVTTRDGLHPLLRDTIIRQAERVL